MCVRVVSERDTHDHTPSFIFLSVSVPTPSYTSSTRRVQPPPPLPLALLQFQSHLSFSFSISVSASVLRSLVAPSDTCSQNLPMEHMTYGCYFRGAHSMVHRCSFRQAPSVPRFPPGLSISLSVYLFVSVICLLLHPGWTLGAAACLPGMLVIVVRRHTKVRRQLREITW